MDKLFKHIIIAIFMVKIGLFGLFTALLLIFINAVNAVTITDLKIIDSLNPDLSMRETILLNIENNTDAEFKLVLPDIAYDVTLNGAEFNNTTISEEIACDNCSTEISFSFSGIVINDSENYTFYRKIEMPINITAFTYKILLPENYSLFNISDLQTSIIPNPDNIIKNDTFEWYYKNPEFPKEFAVRYLETPVIKKPLLEKEYLQYIIFISIILFVFILGLIIGMFIRKRRKR